MHYYPYTLHSRGALNAASVRREFQGALIRTGDGVGCLHPWPEFGDAVLEEQLKLLQRGGSSKVIERALHMASVDGAARRSGVSLFAGLEIPLCHYSWDQNQPADLQLSRVVEEGWLAVKTKGWADTAAVARWLERLARELGTAPVKVRVDFNSCLGEPQFRMLAGSLSDEVKSRIDFVEDPYPYDAAQWTDTRQTLGIRLALDKQLRGAREGFDVAVLKPGRREWREITTELPPSVDIVMTSAMDHAIGQSFAAYEAAVARQTLGSRLGLCGLATEHLFAEDDFFARIHSHGGRLEVDRSGTGLGFDEVLAKLPWLLLDRATKVM